MADAWGGSWGVSWGLSWGSGVAPPPIVLDYSDGGYPKHHEEREQAERSSRDHLRQTVEKAFHRVVHGEVDGSVPVPVARPATTGELKQIATVIRSDIRMDGVSASLKDVQALLSELQASMVAERLEALARQKRREDELMTILLLVS